MLSKTGQHDCVYGSTVYMLQTLKDSHMWYNEAWLCVLPINLTDLVFEVHSRDNSEMGGGQPHMPSCLTENGYALRVRIPTVLIRSDLVPLLMLKRTNALTFQ